MKAEGVRRKTPDRYCLSTILACGTVWVGVIAIVVSTLKRKLWMFFQAEAEDLDVVSVETKRGKST